MNSKTILVVGLWLGIGAVAYGQNSHQQLDSLARKYPLIEWQGSKRLPYMPRSEMYPLMKSLQDPELNNHISVARTKRGVGIACALVATIVSFIPKETTQTAGYGTLTIREQGLFARPIGLVFYVPGIVLQLTASDNDKKAIERYNTVVKERFYR